MQSVCICIQRAYKDSQLHSDLQTLVLGGSAGKWKAKGNQEHKDSARRYREVKGLQGIKSSNPVQESQVPMQSQSHPSLKAQQISSMLPCQHEQWLLSCVLS